MEPKYPNVKVKLTGGNGNAFVVLGSVKRAMQKAKVPQEEIKAFTDEAMGGDYDQLLGTCMKWVDVS